jgi:hypothetical protein
VSKNIQEYYSSHNLLSRLQGPRSPESRRSNPSRPARHPPLSSRQPCAAILAFSLASVSARLLHSLPEDIYAFPKYSVEFLNGIPVLNETAHKWLRHGLLGGELEFLDEPWQDKPPSNRKELDSGDPSPVATPSPIVCILLTAIVCAGSDFYLFLVFFYTRGNQLHPRTYANGSTRIYMPNTSASE